jgi:hypothetical protein
MNGVEVSHYSKWAHMLSNLYFQLSKSSICRLYGPQMMIPIGEFRYTRRRCAYNHRPLRSSLTDHVADDIVTSYLFEVSALHKVHNDL